MRSLGYEHEVTVLKCRKEKASELLPRVHLVISLLKRWLLGTHQGAVSHKHLDYYLDEFTFRFNRRKSMNRGKLLYRIVQQAVAIEPVPLDKILHPEKPQARSLPPRKAPAKVEGMTLLPKSARWGSCLSTVTYYQLCSGSHSSYQTRVIPRTS